MICKKKKTTEASHVQLYDSLFQNDVCVNEECEHNMWYKRAGITDNAQINIMAWAYRGCMCNVVGHQMTEKEIGEVLGVSKQRVDQILDGAIGKLKYIGKRRKILEEI